MPEQEQQQPSVFTYFHQRMELLGITPELNKVSLGFYNADKGDNDKKEMPIFIEDKMGISIRPYTLDRGIIHYAKEGSHHKVHDYAIIRLEQPIVKKDGSVMKYLMPKGQPTVPFFPPQLLEKFEQQTPIEVLYITEGYFKAFKAQMHGIDCVGIPSITCMKDKETGRLHGDIDRLIHACKPQRVVYLTDGDCLNITGKEITDDLDLSNRPKQFFNTIAAFRELLSSAECTLYFAHINTENIEGHPKGLDDLLIEHADNTPAILKDALQFDKIVGGLYTSYYFNKINLTNGTRGVQQYFNLHDVNKFYEYHSERRSELKEKKRFKFYGTIYKFDDESGLCKMEVPADASNYFRCGDDYYEFVWAPNKYGQVNKTVQKRQKSTIRDDFNKDFFRHIPKYKKFVVVPDHENYQQVLNNCFNQYSEFMHQPEEGDCEQTMAFIKHIFGECDVHYKDEHGPQTIKRYELGLDYLSLLYKNPQQVLPILCLVSSERQTGKTTFANWLKMLFTDNMAMVSNEDLGNKFNSHWAAKLLICCDETKIDKHLVMERIKSLSTASSIMKENKGVDQQQEDFFGKFLLLSNNEDNFATIDEAEIRFWVMKVPVIQGRNVKLLDTLKEEIPQFLNFLNKRAMVTAHRERHWFDTQLLRTPELERVIANSKPSLSREIRARLGQMFEDFNEEVLMLPYRAIKEEMLGNKRLEDHYLKKVLRDMGFVTDEKGTQRVTYPRWEQGTDASGKREMQKVIIVSAPTRFYKFLRADFTDIPVMSEAAMQQPVPVTDNSLPFG